MYLAGITIFKDLLFVCGSCGSCGEQWLRGRAVERQTVNQGDGGSIPPTAVSKLRQFRSSPSSEYRII